MCSITILQIRDWLTFLSLNSLLCYFYLYNLFSHHRGIALHHSHLLSITLVDRFHVKTLWRREPYICCLVQLLYFYRSVQLFIIYRSVPREETLKMMNGYNMINPQSSSFQWFDSTYKNTLIFIF